MPRPVQGVTLRVSGTACPEPEQTTRVPASEGGPAVILVEPQLGENIGMAARAMANFGLTDLRLVRPRERWLHEKTRAAAAGAEFLLDQARDLPGVREAVADLDFVYATTARERGQGKIVVGPAEAGPAMRARSRAGRRWAFSSAASGPGWRTTTSRWPTRSSPIP